MREITLKFWTNNGSFRAIVDQEPGVDVERIYVNAADGSSLGYWEKRRSMITRGISYYDRHRTAKGDAIRSVPHEMIFRGNPCVATEVLAAIGVNDSVLFVEQKSFGGDLFDAIARRARDGKSSWFGNTPKTEQKRLRRQRDTAVFTIE